MRALDVGPNSPNQVKGVGIDIASIPRISTLVERYDDATLALLFTPREIEECRCSAHEDRSFTLCFTTKEAVGKALRTGLVEIDWNEIETQMADDLLTVELSGKAKKRAHENQVQYWQISWCEWDQHVMVHALAC